MSSSACPLYPKFFSRVVSLILAQRAFHSYPSGAVGAPSGLSGTAVSVGVGSGVSVGTGVKVAVGDGSGVFVGTGVKVAVGWGVKVKVGSKVQVGVGVSVALKVGAAGTVVFVGDITVSPEHATGKTAKKTTSTV